MIRVRCWEDIIGNPLTSASPFSDPSTGSMAHLPDIPPIASPLAQEPWDYFDLTHHRHRLVILRHDHHLPFLHEDVSHRLHRICISQCHDLSSTSWLTARNMSQNQEILQESLRRRFIISDPF